MSTREWTEFGLNLLRVLLSWPVVVGLLGALLLVRYREPISDVIRRLSALAFPGGGAQFVPPSQETTTPTPSLDETLRSAAAERDTAMQAAEKAVKWWWFENLEPHLQEPDRNH